MEFKRQFISDKAKKPSKLIWLAALLIACLLPIVIVSTFSAKKSTSLTKVVPDASEMEVLQLLTPIQPEKIIPAIEPKPVQKTIPVIKAAPKEVGWVSVNARSGDSMATIFKRVGLSMNTLQVLLQNKPYNKLLTRIKPGQSVQFLIKKNSLEQMKLRVNTAHVLEIVRSQNKYRFNLRSQTTSEPSLAKKSQKRSPSVEIRENYLSATVQYSLYSTAKRHQIPYKLIQQMIDIFHWEINFAKDVRGGDRFSIIYKARYVDNKLESAGEIIAVTYTNRGVAHKALRHVNTAGDVDYFTPQGKSLKQAFSRYPIKFSRINSPFSLSRMHPVLHYNRPHRGIDLAAPMGTPILATGDGRIEVLGYESGYGNVIKIAHHNKLYTSVYAHLLKFQKGIFRGGYVKRGQVIGYVGKSGLATGPHCHYEFHVNHRPKNPSTVPLPHALPVPSRDLASFKHHADKLIEHLKLLEEAQAHSSKKKYHAVG